jgi:1,4-alpha-glucan branching enzyme
MQWINDEIDAHAPSKITIAEDLRNNEWLVKGTGAGGAGFGSQWDSEFVHPGRAAIITGDDEFRDLDAVQGALLHQYDGDAFNRIVYTESHDEVANGKARVTEEIWPGNSLHWFAKKRSTLGAMLVFTVPGIPMIFQGQESLEDRWFDDQDPLDWQQAEALAGFVGLYRDLARLRRNLDGVSKGLSGQFIDVFHVDAGAHVMAYHRWADGGPGDSVVVVLNFAAEPVTDYRLAFPAPGAWTLRFDSHAAAYDPAFGDQVSGDVGAQEEEEGYFGSVSVAPYSGVVYSQ